MILGEPRARYRGPRATLTSPTENVALIPLALTKIFGYDTSSLLLLCLIILSVECFHTGLERQVGVTC
jgi:hypothetical protein